MIKKLSLVLILSLALCYSCKEGKIISLKGHYSIGSFHMQTGYNLDSLNSLGITDFGVTPFEFRDNNVKLSKELGEQFFGGTDFKYKRTKDSLTFYGKKQKIGMSYMHDGVFRLSIDNKYIDRLDLIPTKK
jgi:hypothetical protein